MSHASANRPQRTQHRLTKLPLCEAYGGKVDKDVDHDFSRAINALETICAAKTTSLATAFRPMPEPVPNRRIAAP